MKTFSVILILIFALGLSACKKDQTYVIHASNVSMPVKTLVDEIMTGDSQNANSVGAVQFSKIQGMNMISDSVCLLEDGMTEEHTDKVENAEANVIKLFDDNRSGSYIFIGNEKYTSMLILVVDYKIYKKFMDKCNASKH